MFFDDTNFGTGVGGVELFFDQVLEGGRDVDKKFNCFWSADNFETDILLVFEKR